MIEGLVTKFGKSVAHKVYKITQKTEADGGMEVNVSHAGFSFWIEASLITRFVTDQIALD